MKILVWTCVIGRGSVRPIPLEIHLILVVARVVGLIPFSLANVFQTATLIFQRNILVHQCLEIWKSVYD